MWIFSVISLALPFLPMDLQITLTPFVWCGNFISLTSLIIKYMNMKKDISMGVLKVIRRLITTLGEMEQR